MLSELLQQRASRIEPLSGIGDPFVPEVYSDQILKEAANRSDGKRKHTLSQAPRPIRRWEYQQVKQIMLNGEKGGELHSGRTERNIRSWVRQWLQQCDGDHPVRLCFATGKCFVKDVPSDPQASVDVVMHCCRWQGTPIVESDTPAFGVTW